MRGSQRPGKEGADFLASVQGLAAALGVFSNYRPGIFLALDELPAAVNARHSQQEKK
jgi:hypothetical protein